MFLSEIPPNIYQMGRLTFPLLFLTFSTVLGSSNSGITEASEGQDDSLGHSRKLIQSLLDCINEELNSNVYYDNKPINVKPNLKNCVTSSLLTELLDVVNQAYTAEDSKFASLLKTIDDFKNETRERLKDLDSNLLQSSTLLITVQENVTDALNKLQNNELRSSSEHGLINRRLDGLATHNLQSSTILGLISGNVTEALRRLESHDLQSSTIMSTINQKVTEELRRVRALEYYSLLHYKTAYNISGFRYIPVIRHDLEGRPRNCEEIQAGGSNQSGVYTIFPYDSANEKSVEAYCDLVTDSGGWTVFQRRGPPLLTKVGFERTWDEYANGFGILIDNHWLGLDTIAALTKVGDSMLRVELTDWDDQVRAVTYRSFKVANESELYKLSISGYSGDVGDLLSAHDATSFTTKDRDNDRSTLNCAQHYHGGWWFTNCFSTHLNGIYIENGRNVTPYQGIHWHNWHGQRYSLKRSEMKIRSRDFSHE